MVTDLRSPTLPMTTRAAEGLSRRRWSVAEIEAMVAAGIVGESERFELIEGEVVPTSPKGIRHELVKMALAKFWYRRLPTGIDLIQETTFRIDEDTFVEPDFVFFRAAHGLAALSPATVLLAVEAADTSLHFDLGRKVRIYAGAGVREVWVIDAKSLVTRLHRAPNPQGYAQTPDIASDHPLVPTFAPELSVKLGELELG